MSGNKSNKLRELLLTILFIIVINASHGKSQEVEEPKLMKVKNKLLGEEENIPIDSEEVKLFVNQGLEKYSTTYKGHATPILEEVLSASVQVMDDIYHFIKIRVLPEDSASKECLITVRKFHFQHHEEIEIHCDTTM